MVVYFVYYYYNITKLWSNYIDFISGMVIIKQKSYSWQLAPNIPAQFYE